MLAPMTTKAFVLIVVLAGLVAAGVLAMHGKGHAALAHWLPALHGGSAHSH
jgi:hypothetical protein